MDKQTMKNLEVEKKKLFGKKGNKEAREVLRNINFNADGSAELTNAHVAIRVLDCHDGEVDPVNDYPDVAKIFEGIKRDAADVVTIPTKVLKNQFQVFDKHGVDAVEVTLNRDGIGLTSKGTEAYNKVKAADAKDDRLALDSSKVNCKLDLKPGLGGYSFIVSPYYMANALMFFGKFKHDEVLLQFNRESSYRPLLLSAGVVEYIIAPKRA